MVVTVEVQCCSILVDRCCTIWAEQIEQQMCHLNSMWWISVTNRFYIIWFVELCNATCSYAVVWLSSLTTVELGDSLKISDDGCSDPPKWKTPCCMQTSWLYFYRTGVIADRSFTLQEFSTFLTPVTLTLTWWPPCANLTCIPWRYVACAKMNFLRQLFRKLSSDRQTYRQVRNMYNAASQVVNRYKASITGST